MKWFFLFLFGFFSYATKIIQEDIICEENSLYESSEVESKKQFKNGKKVTQKVQKPRQSSKTIKGHYCGTARFNRWKPPSPTEEPLHWAVLNGDLEKVKKAIDSGVDVNSTYRRGQGKTPLHLAKDLEIVKFLVKKGAKVNAKDWEDQTLLHLTKDLEIIKFLVKNRAKINIKDKEGKTPLHYLVDHIEIAKFLIKHGANVKAKDNQDKTPLHLAGHLEIVKLLVKKRADVNAIDKSGNSPLFYKPLDITQFLIEKGSSINIQNNRGKTLLHNLATGNKNNFELISFLIDKGLDVNITDKYGKTALPSVNNLEMAIFLRGVGVNPTEKDIHQYEHALSSEFSGLSIYAKQYNKNYLELVDKVRLRQKERRQILRIIKEKDILELALNWLDIDWFSNFVKSLNQEDKNKTLLDLIDKSSFLYKDCKRDKEYRKCKNVPTHKKKLKAMLQVLIKEGTDVNLKSAEGQNLLYKIYDPQVTQLFITAGTEVNARDNEGNTPLHVAKNEKIAKLLLDSGIKINAKNNHGLTPLFSLLDLLSRGWVQSPQVIKFLIEKGADIKATDKSGNTLLHASNQAEVTKLLIEKGLDVNAKNNAGVSPLLYVAHRGFNTNPEALKLLIKAGADVNAKDQYGDNILHITSFPETIELLVKEKKMDIHSKGNNGNSVLHSAIMSGQDLNHIKLLIGLGADINQVNSSWYTPLHFVTSYKMDIAKFFIDKGLNVNARTQAGETLLHIVFSEAWGHKDYIKFLIKKGANINAKDNQGETPLYRAIQSRVDIENLQFLIDQGADLNVVNNKGENLCDKAKDKKIKKFIKEKKGCSLSTLFKKNPKSLKFFK